VGFAFQICNPIWKLLHFLTLQVCSLLKVGLLMLKVQDDTCFWISLWLNFPSARNLSEPAYKDYMHHMQSSFQNPSNNKVTNKKQLAMHAMPCYTSNTKGRPNQLIDLYNKSILNFDWKEDVRENIGYTCSHKTSAWQQCNM
jgi:hypothetical protein